MYVCMYVRWKLGGNQGREDEGEEDEGEEDEEDERRSYTIESAREPETHMGVRAQGVSQRPTTTVEQ